MQEQEGSEMLDAVPKGAVEEELIGLGVFLAPANALAAVVTGASLVFLAVLGGLAAWAGGARATVGALRVTFWGALAMAITYGVGALFAAVA